MGQYYVGLDVHSRESVFVIQDEAGTIVARGAMSTTPDGLARFCRDHRLPVDTPVALETGTSAFYVARALAALKLRPVVTSSVSRRRGTSSHPDGPVADRPAQG